MTTALAHMIELTEYQRLIDSLNWHQSTRATLKSVGVVSYAAYTPGLLQPCDVDIPPWLDAANQKGHLVKVYETIRGEANVSSFFVRITFTFTFSKREIEPFICLFLAQGDSL